MKDQIAKIIRGEIDSSAEVLEQSSVDASIFKVKPSLVVKPRDAADLGDLVTFVGQQRHRGVDLSLTARNGGTCMSGGPLTESIVVSLNKYFDDISEVHKNSRLLWVQAGTMHRDIELATRAKGLLFAPYTSSHDICGIGGMIGNNASGEMSIKYGPTSSNVEKLKAVLSDGNEYLFQPTSAAELTQKLNLSNFEGHVYREVTKLIDENRHLIDHNHPRVRKNAAGYALWDLWDQHHQTFNLGRLFIGSQGTLGIVTAAQLKLVHLPKNSRMIVVPITSLSELAHVVKTMLLFNPDTLETFDHYTYDLAKQYHPEDASRASLADGKHMIVFAIYSGDSQHQADVQAGKAKIKLENSGKEVMWVDDQATLESILLIRRKSFKMLLDHPHQGQRAMAFLEDTIVPIEHYGDFLASLEDILGDYKMTYTYAGHIGDGSIRLVPLVNVEGEDAADQIFELSERVYDLVFAFGGSMSVDHNDGLIRTPFLERMYGPEMVTLFARVKEIFDPHGVFNPGKKVGGSLDYSKAHIVKTNAT
jgi:FAD/FMN-containing dehydrogenase